MVNFRFHLVSLTAVFLALGIGIAVGATVVDKATVELLQDRLDGLEGRLDRTDTENAQLRGDVARWSTFAEEAGEEAVAGRLEGVPVLVVAVQGMDRRPIEALHQSLAAARARLQGTVWLTDKLDLGKPEDTGALADLVGDTGGGADAVRRAAVNRLAAELGGAEPPSGLLPALRDAAFVEFEPPAGEPVDLGAVPVAGTRFVVVSGVGAGVADAELALPLAGQLARAAGGRVLAAEPGRDPKGERGRGQRALFVGPLRADDEVARLLSTVDNLEDVRGRFAAVYALRDLEGGRVGHFGVGPGAGRVVPEVARR